MNRMFPSGSRHHPHWNHLRPPRYAAAATPHPRKNTCSVICGYAARQYTGPHVLVSVSTTGGAPALGSCMLNTSRADCVQVASVAAWLDSMPLWPYSAAHSSHLAMQASGHAVGGETTTESQVTLPPTPDAGSTDYQYSMYQVRAPCNLCRSNLAPE